jgi:cytochrome c oxidase subunit 2
VGIAVAVVAFAYIYRRRKDDERPPEIHGSLLLELTWSVVPFLITIVIFFWSTTLYFSLNRPPDDAMQVSVVGKQWMWKIQHPTGQREINQLHVPVNRAVRLTMTSEDVLHSFYVPAFRMKKDTVPGRYTQAWFKATKTGTFHLFCAEYCGTKHSGMIGQIVVMEPDEYQAWLAGGVTSTTPVAAGERLFQELNCVTCHQKGGSGRGPILEGLFGKPVKLASGEVVTADETYLRESILTPAAKVVEGYQPVMPAYQGLVTEESVLQLIAYLQSLKTPEGAPGAAPAPAAPAGR